MGQKTKQTNGLFSTNVSQGPKQFSKQEILRFPKCRENTLGQDSYCENFYLVILGTMNMEIVVNGNRAVRISYPPTAHVLCSKP